MFRALSIFLLYFATGLKDMVLLIVGLFRDTAAQEFADLKSDWKYELGQQSGYPFWKFFEPNDSQHPTMYSPLPSNRYMRVLQVMCSATRPSKQFVGNLVPVCVDSPEIPYIAISYTWGDASLVAEIDLKNGNAIPITRSVYVILDTLLEKGQILRLWIDAICINQRDAEEKNLQVQMMRDIYKNADYVVVSLGEADLETEAAMDYIYSLRKVINQEDEKIRQIENSKNSYRPAQRKELFLSIEKWAMIENLLQKPWFQRVWVIQETAVGPEPLVVCGQRAVQWRTLCQVVFGYLMHYSSLRRDIQNGTSSDGNNYSPSFPVGLLNLQLMDSARKCLQEGGGEPLQTVLLYMNHFRATDPRDKVFGLLGLGTNTKDEAIQADYRSTQGDAYRTVSRQLLIRDSFIYILNNAGIGFPRSLTDIPSWVPDFGNGDAFNFSRYLPQSVKFQASGNSKSAVTPGPSENSIVVGGIRIDTVWRLTDPCDPACTNWFSQIDALFKVVQRLPAFEMNKIVREQHIEGKESWIDALYHAILVCTARSDFRTDADAFGKDIEVWREYQLNQNHNLDKAMHEHVEDHVRDRGIGNLLLDQPTELEGFRNICSVTAGGRRFFITRTGFLGVTSLGTREGDLAVIFLGGITPFILRESTSFKGDFSLVGEAYIHDIMYGEAMESQATEFFCLI